MRTYHIGIALVFIMTVSAWAQEHQKSNENEFLYEFLEGSYHLIGRLPDSDKTYYGKVVLRNMGDKLEVIRRIEGKEIKGIGNIETATADKIKVLRIRFMEDNKKYEVTYLIDSDLDNYGRLTGYLYLKGKETEKPGLEALFIDHP
jgi:hypothetical protein